MRRGTRREKGKVKGKERLIIVERKKKAISRRWKLLQELEDVCMQCYDLQTRAMAVL